MSERKSSQGRVDSPPIELYAWALEAPPGRPRVRLIELDDKWHLEELPKENHLVVGRPPLRSVKPFSVALSNGLRRSTFASSIRKKSPRHRLVASQKLPPPPGTSGASGALRKWLLSGALYQLSTDGRFETLFDLIGRAAGVGKGPTEFHASGDGSIVARFIDVSGRDAVLRAAPAGSPSDPAGIADALEHLHANGVPNVPRLLGRGEVEEVSWMSESFLSGNEPTGIDEGLQEQVVSFCAQLPAQDGPPTAVMDELAIVADALPERASKIQEMKTRLAPALERLPAVTRHGDLWAGNLLVDGGRLVGIVDWAAWHNSAAPGTDLLHLWAAEKKKGSRRELGETWRSSPWTDSNWLRVTAPYWGRLGVDPDRETLEVVSVAWWATWVAQSLVRHPARGRSSHWVQGNVDAVLESFA